MENSTNSDAFSRVDLAAQTPVVGIGGAVCVLYAAGGVSGVLYSKQRESGVIKKLLY
jgi:hypothetical protein